MTLAREIFEAAYAEINKRIDSAIDGANKTWHLHRGDEPPPSRSHVIRSLLLAEIDQLARVCGEVRKNMDIRARPFARLITEASMLISLTDALIVESENSTRAEKP